MRVRRVYGVGIAVALCVMGAVVPDRAAADRAMAPRFATNTQGDIALIGNTLLSCTVSDPICASARQGTASPASENNNNAHFMDYVDVDADPSTFDSSSATLSLPTGARVLFAGLYWGGKPSKGTGGSPAPASATRDTVKLSPPGAAGPAAVTATTVDTSGSFYQSFADVTALVSAAGSGTYTVANADLGTGRDDLQQGGWALVVAYGDASAPSRNLVVFDGFEQVASRANVTVPLSGFRTPLSGDVRTTVGLVAQEGDLAASGDSAAINGTALANAVNPANNVFNSTVSDAGVITTDRDPDYVNTLGWDVDLFPTLNVLGNDQTSTTVDLATTLDTYAPGVVTIATDLYAPRIEAVKTVDRASADLGDELTYTVRLTNSGQDAADALMLTDTIPAGTTFVGGSLQASPVTADAACPAFTGPALPDPAGDRLSVPLGTAGRLGVGQTQCVRFRVRINSGGLASGTVISNAARADFTAATTGAADAGVETAPAVTDVLVPDLAVIKSHAPALVPGGLSAFTITIPNVGDGPSLGPVTVRDTLAADFTLTGAPSGPGWACATAGSPVTITCTRSDPLAGGASYPPITVPVRVAGTAAPGTLSNTATVQNTADGNPANDSATDAGAVSQPLVDLVVTKTAPDRPINGTAMPYAITVTNRGVSPAPDVVVTDTLPPTFALVSVDPSQGSCVVATCSLGTLEPGATATIGLLTQPPFPDFPGDTDFTNTVQATSGGHEENPADNVASVTRRSVPVVDPFAIVEVGPHVVAGGPITVTYRIGNRGPQAADVHGTGDLLDLDTGLFGLPNQTAVLTRGPGECVLDSPGNNFCGFPAIAPGEERIVTQTATVPAVLAGHTLRIRINGLPSQYEPFTKTGDDSDEVTVTIPGVNVAVDKARIGGTGPVAPGGEATFRLTARNAGGLAPAALNLEATGVTVSDPLPAGMTLVEVPPGCRVAGQVVTCDAGTLALGQTRSFDLLVRVDASAGASLTNTATVTAAEPDWQPADDHASAVLDVAPATVVLGVAQAADVSVDVRPPAGRVRDGDTSTWRVTAANAGPSAATGVTLAATPQGGAVVGVRASQAGCRLASPAGCDLGMLAAGARRTITLRLRRSDPGRLALEASIRAAQTDPRPANNRDRAEIRVRTGRAIVSLSKTAATDTVAAGRTVSFTIIVRVAGRRAARSLSVCDRPPSGLRLMRAHYARPREGAVCWQIERLDAGQTRRLKITARTLGRPGTVRQVVNQATLRGANVRRRRAHATIWITPRPTSPCVSTAQAIAHTAC